MPGITGIISKNSKEENKNKIQLMLKTMIHEKDYSFGYYNNDDLGIYLGWTCLKGSFSDCMPIWNEKKDKILLFYGENFIDNEQIYSLIKKKHVFDIKDASYLIHLYEEKGEDFLLDLNGFFNGVLIDLVKKEVIIFNDIYGMQRMYFYENKNNFFFSCEAKSILKICPETREIIPESLMQQASLECVLENKTLYKDIYLIPGASKWKFRNGICEKREQYFDKKEWEDQSTLDKEEFYKELLKTVDKIMPKYTNDRPIAFSLTGGLDSRIVMSHTDFSKGSSFPCYTFGSMYRDNYDVKIGRKVAKMSDQEHEVIKVGKDFLSNFENLAKKTVYISDGCADVSCASELYTNKIASKICPVRMTGNYGSEVLRSSRAFKPRISEPNFFNNDFIQHIKYVSDVYNNTIKDNSVSFIVFKQCPLYHYNRLSIEQSQIIMRTPFMDNEFVKLMYRANKEDLNSNKISLRLIKDGNIKLSEIITDRGIKGDSTGLFSKFRESFIDFYRKAEYCYDYGMPNKLYQVDHSLSFLHLEKIFLGHHKFNHYRIWYNTVLANFVKEVLLDPKTLNRQFLNKKYIEKMISNHYSGKINHTRNIHRLLSYEFIERLLINQN
jgi:asparagine synthase (glutamine-hydrolysing)